MEQLNGALITGLEARVTSIEDKFEDLDARTAEESDNALNERELDRFIMSGESSFVVYYNLLTLAVLFKLKAFASG